MKRGWPDWWYWDLELSPHLWKRMADRRFTEADLRAMLDRARTYCEDHVQGRFAVQTRHGRRRWVVIVEPDGDLHVVVVITAYPVD